MTLDKDREQVAVIGEAIFDLIQGEPVGHCVLALLTVAVTISEVEDGPRLERTLAHLLKTREAQEARHED